MLWKTIATTMLLAVALGGCTSPPPAKVPPKSYLVLLENDDGSIGRVQLTTAQGTTNLATAGQATRLHGAAGDTFEVSAAKIKQDFGSSLAASPQKPTTYLLYFEAGGAKLTPESQAEVNKIQDEINNRPVPDISIIGHTDTAGDADANEKLGFDRARFVAKLLAATKVDAGKIALESHGKKNLLIPTPDNTSEPRNRRVEVTVR
jgi:outer membrane protein OmpA-like peptidoglycan-associated protein